MNSEFKELFGTPSAFLRPLFDAVEYPWQMLEKLLVFLQELPLGQIDGSIDKRAYIQDESLIYLGKGAEIGPGALIEGQVFLGNNVKIRHGAYIRGPVFIDEGAVVGHASEVKHTIFFKNSSAAHFNYVGNSILGVNAQLGAGAICANLRFDKKPINVRFNEKKMSTEHKKMGALVGHDVKIGCQAVLSPGCVIEPGAIVYPLTSVQGFYERKK